VVAEAVVSRSVVPQAGINKENIFKTALY
jgi:hypothetical protein